MLSAAIEGAFTVVLSALVLIYAVGLVWGQALITRDAGTVIPPSVVFRFRLLVLVWPMVLLTVFLLTIFPRGLASYRESQLRLREAGCKCRTPWPQLTNGELACLRCRVTR